MNTSLIVINEGKETSHVIIGFDGSVIVKISDKDYHDYRERLSFDQLYVPQLPALLSGLLAITKPDLNPGY